MKKKSILMILLALVLSMAMIMTACGGSKDSSDKGDSADPVEEQQSTEAVEQQSTEAAEQPSATTIEEYVLNDEHIKRSLEASVDEEEGISIEYQGNIIIYSYDISHWEGYTEEQAKTEGFISALDSSIDKSIDSSSIGNFIVTLESVTGISGISIVYNYTWENYILTSRAFTAADAE